MGLLKNKKVLIVLVALLLGVGGGGGYMMFMAGPSKAGPPPVMLVGTGEPFSFSLADVGHYAKATIVIGTISKVMTAPAGDTTSPAAVWLAGDELDKARDAINTTFSEFTSDQLLSPDGQRLLRQKLAENIGKEAKIKVTEVLLTDYIVQ